MAERADMLGHVRRIIEEELTERQRKALTMLAIQDISMENAARKLKTNRNALYKLLHDARLRLKSRLAREDISAHDVMSLFEEK
jgi:RNA polymerase sigma-70 factor (ECF subfamily)